MLCDLLSQILNYCTYNDLPMEMLPEHFDRVVKSYFTVVIGDGTRGQDSGLMATRPSPLTP